MPVWKLIPTDLADPNWQASSHRGLAVVRAPNEHAARKVAQAAFDVATHFPPGDGARFPPWSSPTLVKAEEIEDARYDAKGPTELLEPLF